MVIFDNAPPDVVPSTDQMRCCWNCAFYSFKVYAGDADNSGKCFRDRDTGKVYWVRGDMLCPGWKWDESLAELE